MSRHFSTIASMFFDYLNWAVSLSGVSPIARLLAIRMANYARPLSAVPDDLAPDEPACELDVKSTLVWIGCTKSKLAEAAFELADHGVNAVRLADDKLLFTFPELERPDRASSPRADYLLTIYVISSGAFVSKIGISKYPEYRLANLQAANPLQALKIEWSSAGASKLIRRVERAAHKALADQAIGNEWFRVDSGRAMQVVQSLLEAEGGK